MRTGVPMALMQRLKRKLFPPRDVIEGYESEELVETIFRKTIAYDPAGDWPLVAGISSVLDFGGGAGLHYKLARKQAPDIRWAVVETPAMARRARQLATNRLMFFSDIHEAADWLGDIELMHSNGAIQYVPDAIETIRTLSAARPAAMVWYRVPISDADAKAEVQTSFLSDNGPGSLSTSEDKLVKYARNWIPSHAFVGAHRGYRVAESSRDPREHGTQQFRFVRH
jgi:putative methyltransferase (TIGR04325 family)